MNCDAAVSSGWDCKSCTCVPFSMSTTGHIQHLHETFFWMVTSKRIQKNNKAQGTFHELAMLRGLPECALYFLKKKMVYGSNFNACMALS